MRAVAHEPAGGTREFLLGLAVAFSTMIVVALVTLYVLGAFSSAEPSTQLGGRVYTAEDLTPAPKPTAVWKFRSEWQKPSEP